MNTQEKIINYLAQRTNGVLTLTEADADNLIALCSQPAAAIAIQSKYNAVKQSYEHNRTFNTTDTAIGMVMATHKTQVEHFYRYELYDSTGAALQTIYSLNSDLL